MNKYRVTTNGRRFRVERYENNPGDYGFWRPVAGAGTFARREEAQGYMAMLIDEEGREWVPV